MALTESQAKHNLSALIDKFNRLSTDDRKQMSEASVVRQFIDILLRDVLDWPIEDPARYRYEQVTQAGRPDMMLTPPKGGTIFVEAKRFGIIKELEQARRDIRGVITPGQLALPGMAVDRIPIEQQAINYAFANSGTWAILTNFEKLRLFNARRDWLVLSFERPKAYQDDFDLLWQLAYPNVMQGSLETLSNQRLTAEVDTDYLHFINEWREKLAQDIVSRQAENPWAFITPETIDLVTLRAVVQRVIDRLVMIRFAEDHLVMPPGTLRSFYELQQQTIYADLAQLLTTMFRRFDKFHNSALFAPGLADQASFSEETLSALLKKLNEARYRSMPADIMGNTYEQYLGKTLIRRNGSIATADNLETRKKQGSYYTPQVIVRYIVDHSLGRYLYATENGQPDGTPIPGALPKTSADIQDLRALDSACGSGSFLIYAYQVLDGFYEREKARLQAEFEAGLTQLGAQGMRPNDIRIELAPLQAEMDRIQNHQRLILERHLYGVDLDPQAAEIAVVNLMMRAMERRYGDKRLPLILNQNVKVGNSLIGLRPDDPRMAKYAARLAELHRLRADLIRIPHTLPAHDQIIADLKRTTEALTFTLTPEIGSHFSTVGTTDEVQQLIHPFCWGVEFPEVFYDEHGQLLDNPGFTVIFGNPPWEILKPDLREFYAQFDPDIEQRLNRQKAEARIAELDAEDPRRRGAYEANLKIIELTAAYVRHSKDYQRQGRGDIGTHKLFLERMYSLLRREGQLGYLVPSGIYSDLGTKELREMLMNEGRIESLIGLSNVKGFFPEVDSRFKFTLLNAQKGPSADGFRAAFRIDLRVGIGADNFAEFVEQPENFTYVRRDSLARFSPDSLGVMEFQSHQDYEIAEKIYGTHPTLGETVEGSWSVKFTSEFHITNDRELFNTRRLGLPLYEGKMIHQYDAFYDAPRFWLDELPASKRLASKYRIDAAQLDYFKPRLAFRGIARSTDQRTLFAAILPPRVFSEGRTATTLIQQNITTAQQIFLAACLNSFTLDWILRLKVAANINMFYIYQLPIPRLTSGNRYFDALVPRAARLTCIRSEFAELWQQVMGDPWDESKGAVDPAERQRLRDEIDALVAHLYGLSRADFEHILGTFPLVFPDSEAGRAKRSALLTAYEAWSE